MKIEVNETPRQKNDRIAEENRKRLAPFRVLNMIGSPGAGKTFILEKTAEVLGQKLAVIEGDIQTDLDAQRITKHGSRAVQIETGGACHLNAQMVKDALDQLDLTGVQVVIIENVGNLVCPSGFDLGEDTKVAVVSLPEGDEKPIKYPNLFMRAQAVIINKIDLAELLEYSIERVKDDCRKLNSSVKIFKMSAKTGQGIEEWVEYITGDIQDSGLKVEAR